MKKAVSQVLTNEGKRYYNITMNRNYENEMLAIMDTIPKGERLLLHSCCAPCSSACLERLKDTFQVTVLYYNPNIDDKAEYEKRKAEQIRFLQETGWADFLDCDHDSTAFSTMAKGLEEEPERGKRCYLCYGLRLNKTAETAKKNGFTWFATTLTLSPHKNADWLNELGEQAAQTQGINYLPTDFKKKGGYPRSIALSKEHTLYRQDFCGCKYSKR